MKKVIIAGLALGGILTAGNAMAGDYYLYADFTATNTDNVYQGGYDVDSYGDYIYVNRDGTQVDKYMVTTIDSDGNGDIEPNQHPDNVGPDGTLGTSDDAIGPMETRTLTLEATYNVSTIGTGSRSEIFADANGFYFLDKNDAVSYYDTTFNTVSVETSSFGSHSTATGYDTRALSQLGRRADGTWIASNEVNDVYQYNATAGTWDALFTHSLFPGGGHLDGLEVASLDGVEYIFISDMYADNIGRYDFSGNLLETYTYPGSGSSIVVEGMGFGANDHFWMTGSGHLYEVGGGALTHVHDPVPEPATMLLFGTGLAGIIATRRKKTAKK